MKSAIIVSTFPPAVCGIAAYAEQQARQLEELGEVVLRISPRDPGKNAELCEFSTFHGILRYLWLILFRKKQSLTLHYADRFYLRLPEQGSEVEIIRAFIRLFQLFALMVTGLIMGKNGQMIVHEINLDKTMPLTARLCRTTALRFFGTLSFHSAAQRDAVIGCIPQIIRSRTQVISHGRFLKRYFQGTQSEARASLSLSVDHGPIFLCLGFWNSSKGFEDAIDAFVSMPKSPAKLYIVGSPKDDAEEMAYAGMLESRIPRGSGINLVRKTLSDGEFDQWLQASDVVILPYHAISSSGVAARASLYGKKLIMRKLAPFEEEYPEGIFFSTTDELARILRTLSEDWRN
jgi:glycosyltransferase involved in cell wall biosynthesis